MNTIEILVLIFLGFLILNSSLDTLKEGLENSESGVDKLLKDVQKQNLNNSHRVEQIIKTLTQTSKDYEELQKKLKNTKTNTEKMHAVKGHSSVVPLPPRSSAAPEPPKGSCPSKVGTINWGSFKEGLANSPDVQREHQLQEQNVWLPGFTKVRKGVAANETKLSTAMFLTVIIEELGNGIQSTLQKNKF